MIKYSEYFKEFLRGIVTKNCGYIAGIISIELRCCKYKTNAGDVAVLQGIIFEFYFIFTPLGILYYNVENMYLKCDPSYVFHYIICVSSSNVFG